jgi:hypothetical protein
MKKNGFDIIGDMHGYADQLTALLQKMDYRLENNVFVHPERQAVFVGDFIDRGPKIPETLSIVKAMIDRGTAKAVMGNHEFNAIGYATIGPDGDYLRRHTPPREKQHEATLAAFCDRQDEWKSYLKWFHELPLFLDLDGIRVVHACWDDVNIDRLKKVNKGLLSHEMLVDGHAKGEDMYILLEETLKGKEYELPMGHFFHDKDGHPRHRARIKWWKNPNDLNYGDYLFGISESLPLDIPAEAGFSGYPSDAKPVFFGHYWLKDDRPALQAPNVACLDFSVAAGGFLCAYRWSGENPLREEHFVTTR